LKTNNITLDSPIRCLSKKPTKTIESLEAAGLKTIFDLLWIIPLRIFKNPPVKAISMARDGEYFRGQGKVVSFQSRPNFRAHGKGRVPLNNLTIVILDPRDNSTLHLKWFNCYPSVISKLKELDEIYFSGMVQSFQGVLQIISPETSSNEEPLSPKNDFIIQYPTINGLNSNLIKKLIDKIPVSVWEMDDITFPGTTKLLGLIEAMTVLHGKYDSQKWNEELKQKARNSLAYFEFFCEQLKHKVRKGKLHHSPAIKMEIQDDEILTTIKKSFPYELTLDQVNSLKDVFKDLSGPGPMMRMIQGDVGCGKTTVAFGSALAVIEFNHQVAIMAPTESLAQQHYKNFKIIADRKKINIALLLGGSSIS